MTSLTQQPGSFQPVEYPKPLLQPEWSYLAEWSYLESQDMGLLDFRVHDSRLSSGNAPQGLCAEGSCTDVLVRVDLNVIGQMKPRPINGPKVIKTGLCNPHCMER